MRPIPLTVLKGGINRQRIKGGASINQLYDLQNAYITVEGSVVPREGTIRAATLDGTTVGLAVLDGVFNVFSTALQTVPSGYQCNILAHPTLTTATLETIWFAKPFMGFLYVTAEFNTGDIYDYWLQNNGTWTASFTYTSGSIVLPDTANGYAYLAVRDAAQNPLWTAQTIVTANTQVEPNEYTGFYYRAVAVAGTNPHTSSTEPVWPTVAGGTVQEFGDFDLSSTDAGTTNGSSTTTTGSIPLGANITDRYGDSADIANSGTSAGAAVVTTATVSTNITVWQPGTNYAPGAVVRPSATQGAYTNAIPNGDFENGNDGNWVFSGTNDWEYATTNQYQGQYCLEYPATGSTAAANGDAATMLDYAVVTPGQSVTVTCYLNPNNAGANLTLEVGLLWFNASSSLISSGFSAAQEGGGYRQVAYTAAAPAGATQVKAVIRAGTNTTSRNPGFADLCAWNLEQPATVSNFLYEAVQAQAGASGSSQPTWPTTLNSTVVDGGVTWEAIGTSIITWEAIPLLYSGTTEPTFTTGIGTSVYDTSSYTDKNGVVLNTSMSWQCTNRQITDTNHPDTLPTVIGASHVFKGNRDITSYSAAVDPTDWTSTNNAGYLPTGLNNYGDNPVAALALYRSNLIVFNAGGYQMWQIDPDPANMALLDAEPVGSIWPRALQSVSNDLLFLTEVGVRNLSTVGATANMAIGNTGQPIDPLVVKQLNLLSEGGSNPNATFVLAASGGSFYTGYSNGATIPAYGTVTPSPVTIIGLDGNTYELSLFGGEAPYGAGLLTVQLQSLTGTTVPNGIFDYLTITSGSVTDTYYLSSSSYSTLYSTMGQWQWEINNHLTEGLSFNCELFVEAEQPVYQPISLYYPGRGQYWLIFGAQAFVMTMNGSNQKNWSRYLFPQALTDWALNGETLYIRTTGNLVWQLDAGTLVDDYLTTNSSSGIVFDGLLQWPYLDLNSLAANKMMMGFDLVGDGDVAVQFGYNQQDPSSFNDAANFTNSTSVSAPYTLAIAGTVPGTPVPMPINAPAVTVILTFPGNQAWTWEAFNIYVIDQRGGGMFS